MSRHGGDRGSRLDLLTARNLNSAENFLRDNVMAPLSIHCKKMLNELSHFRGPLQCFSNASLHERVAHG